MRKNPVDSGQSDQPDPISWQRRGMRRLRARFTPVRVAIGALALLLLIISIAISLSGVGTSYASVLRPLAPDTCAATVPVDPTCTDTPTATDTPTPTPTDTPTPPPTDTPTPVKTAKPKPTATKVPTAVPPVSATATAVATATATAGASPTATVTGDAPTPGTTPTTGTVPTGNTSTPSTPSQPGSNGGPRVAVIVGSVLVVLLLGLGAGWFYFRRMLMPQGTPNPNLPPSGARPWSRNRAPNPDSLGGLANAQVALAGAGNYGPGGPGGPGPNMFAGPGNVPSTPNVYNGPGPAGFGPQGPAGNGFGPQGPMGNGFGGFSDGFIPPSPQIFPQGENSMIPPGSGAFPVITNAGGVAPASPAFNAMYGLPDDPFSGSQAGSPGWMSNLGNGNASGGPQAPKQGNAAPGMVDLNDPYLAEVIRQYSQKSQSVQPSPVPPQQMSPNGPMSMPPNGPMQQMSPNGPMSMPPNGPPQQMSPNGPMSMPPNGPPQQMSPNGPPSTPPGRPPMQPNRPQQIPPRPQQPPPSQIPQREPRTGFQDSNWLQ